MSRVAVETLQRAGHDVIWTGQFDRDPGDEQILAMACDQNRILITLDNDFGELVIVHEQPHGGILRLVNFRSTQQGEACFQILRSHGEELESGALVTAAPRRLRIRPRNVNQ